jgi:hypothetical protein
MEWKPVLMQSPPTPVNCSVTAFRRGSILDRGVPGIVTHTPPPRLPGSNQSAQPGPVRASRIQGHRRHPGRIITADVGDAPGAPIRGSRSGGLIWPGRQASVGHAGHTRSRTQITPFRGMHGRPRRRPDCRPIGRCAFTFRSRFVTAVVIGFDLGNRTVAIRLAGSGRCRADRDRRVHWSHGPDRGCLPQAATRGPGSPSRCAA